MQSNQSIEASIVAEIKGRVAKEFLDIIILSEAQDGELNGYDIIALMRTKFSLSISPGTVYATLYALEKQGLLCGACMKDKHLRDRRNYTITMQGTQKLAAILTKDPKIRAFAKTFLKVSAATELEVTS